MFTVAVTPDSTPENDEQFKIELSNPVNVALLKSAFLELRDRGKTLLFSTHQLEQAEELCDAVAIIDHGRIITSGTTREVKRSTGSEVTRRAGIPGVGRGGASR